MSTVSSTNTNSHYNPDEPRDPHGRWTTGGSSWRANPVRRPEPAGRAHLLLGHAHASAWHQGLIREFKLPTDAEAGRFARTLAAWNAASDLDPETFREHFTHGLVDKPVTVARLRQAAAGSAEAKTIGEMVDASRPLTQAIREIGAHRWPWVREGLADRAETAMPRQFAAPVGTTAATVGTGQTGMAAGDRPQGRGSGTSDEERSQAPAHNPVEPAAASRLQEASMSGMNLYKTREGYFDLASMFNSEPVPMLDDQGQPVIGASGKPVMIPRLADPHFFVDMGLASNSLDSTMKMTQLCDLLKFRIGHDWDLQRNPKFNEALRDGATIAIGLYAAAAGIPESALLTMQNTYAGIYSSFNEPMDETYGNLAKRNVENTHIGYELYRSHRIGPSADHNRS
jgi:hypothetical protein